MSRWNVRSSVMQRHSLCSLIAGSIVGIAVLLSTACVSNVAQPAQSTVRSSPTAAVSEGTATAVSQPTAAARHCAPPYPAPPLTTDTVFCADPTQMQSAKVTRIVDGDTIHVDIGGREEIIRFYGINTTEHGQPCFDEGTERTRELVGKEVRLLPDARNRDRYGRLLRYVYTPDGLSVDAEMVAEGMAHAWREDGKLRVPIIALEDAAREKRLGCLWDGSAG